MGNSMYEKKVIIKLRNKKLDGVLAILINKTKYDSIIVGSCVVQIIKKKLGKSILQCQR